MNRTTAALALAVWTALPITALALPDPDPQTPPVHTLADINTVLTDEAIDNLTDTLKQHPHLADAYLKRAQFYNQIHQSDLALADYRAFFQNCKHPTAKQTRTVHDGVRAAYVDKAIADLKACIATGKAPEGAYLLLAQCSLTTQDYPEAIAAYSHLIERTPQTSEAREQAYIGRGVCYLLRAQATKDTPSALAFFDQAIADFDQAAALFPTDSLPQLNKDTALDLKEKRQKS